MKSTFVVPAMSAFLGFNAKVDRQLSARSRHSAAYDRFAPVPVIGRNSELPETGRFGRGGKDVHISITCVRQEEFTGRPIAVFRQSFGQKGEMESEWPATGTRRRLACPSRQRHWDIIVRGVRSEGVVIGVKYLYECGKTT